MQIQTPGVYVQEIPSLPPGVAEVKSAIPAFLGYTEKIKYNETSIKHQPIKIQSMLEFKSIFGDAVPYRFTGVTASIADTEKNAKANPLYYLFDSLQLYFLNGGGPCFIVSLGEYPNDNTNLETADYDTAFDALDLFDEPTIYVMPDAVLLSDDKLSMVQQIALTKCATLMDRFAILDVKQNTNPLKSLESVEIFREKIGMAHLSYGAAYASWLNTNLQKKITSASIPGIFSLLSGLDSSILNFEIKGKKISETIDEYSQLSDDLATLKTNINTLVAAPQSFKSIFTDEIANVSAANSGPFQPVADPAALASAHEIALVAEAAAAAAETFVEDHPNATVTEVFDAALDAATAVATPPASAATNPAVEAAQNAATAAAASNDARTAANAAAAAETAAGAAEGILTKIKGTVSGAGNAAFTGFFDKNYEDYIDILKGAYDGESDKQAYLRKIIQDGTLDRFDDVYAYTRQGLQSVIDSYEQVLVNNIPYYASLLSVLKNKLTSLPPSGAMAGLYCQTDSARGVWKSPANISVSGVNGVTQLYSAPDLDALNIDATAGKSVNAIRPIVGKGVMVMGARTLDGNSSEWRYVTVRRLFIFLEENLKKNTAWAIFEPNDKMLWTSIKAQINNYLFELWKLGALAGSKPEDAYQVNCGLNSTMTPQDILKGFLYIEIKLAAVRPAEFIVLKFSHQLQKS